jgi:hypothetical protein
MLYLTKEIAMFGVRRRVGGGGWGGGGGGVHLAQNLFGDDERKSCFKRLGITVVFKAI